jgi:vitamin B12 transporter
MGRGLFRKTAGVLLGGTFLGSSSIVAIAQQSAMPVVELPAIAVSPTTIPTPTRNLASSVTVITAEEMERDQRRTVSDALLNVPGVNVVQSGGPGGQTSIFIRGSNSNHVKVLIDGIEVSDPSTSNRAFDFGNLLTNDVERIEVLRGPQSGLYGADAIGGVVSITTKKGNGPLKATGTLEAGSLGTFNQFGNLSGSHGGFNYSVNVAHTRSTDIPVTPERILPPGQRSFDNVYDNQTYSTKLGYDFNQFLSVNWVARYTDGHTLFTGGAVPDAQRSTLDVEQFHTRGEAVVTLWDGRFKNYFGVNYSDNKTASVSPIFGPSLNNGQRTAEDWRGVLSIMPGQTLVAGVDHYSESAQSNNTNAGTGNTGAYLEWQGEFANRFFVVANIRNDWHDDFGSHTTYRIAPAFIVPGTETKLKATYGTGFKPPSVFQLYASIPPFFFGNPNLDPETSKGYDFGFEQPLLNDRMRFGVTRYVNKIENGINSDTTFTTLINVDSAEIRGYEAFALFNVSPELTVRGDYTYTSITATNDAAIVRRPPHKYSATVVWMPTPLWQFSANVVTTSAWLDFDRVTFATVRQNGYTTVNLAANYQLNPQTKLFARIDNLFDEKYENPNGFLKPGFGVFGGITVASR